MGKLLTSGFWAEASEWLKTSSAMVLVDFFENHSQIEGTLKFRDLQDVVVRKVHLNAISVWQKRLVL